MREMKLRDIKHWLGLLLVCVLAACAETQTPVEHKAIYSKADFSDLEDWRSDVVLQSMPVLQQSCAAMAKKKGWGTLCADLRAHAPETNDGARAFYEKYFRVYAVRGETEQGLFTGYYEASLRGSDHADDVYKTPLYARPDNLVMLDLGAFKPDWRGQKLTGKLVSDKTGQKLIPFDDRASIDKGSLEGHAKVLAWVDDPVDAFFLAIQGSGRVTMADGRVIRVGYDGANGMPYVAVGKVLGDAGELQKPVTMQGIRQWLRDHPSRAQSVMNQNPSYVFFRILPDGNPVGALGVPLTPEHSMAVDPAAVPLGSPVWLETTDAFGEPLHRLMQAQDTGGAIKGAVRGDFFWGFGDRAEAEAGAMQSKGRYFVLIPCDGDVP